MIIGVDIDGVLASFEHGFTKILKSVSGNEYPELGTPGWPDIWDWDKRNTTTEQRSEAWKRAANSHTFWLNLPSHPHAEDFLGFLDTCPADVYFITSRIGHRVKWQTERWLKDHGFTDHPTVLISSEKGLCCKALKINYYIDDKTENCEDVIAKSPDTKVWMLQAAYNKNVQGLDNRGNLKSFQDYLYTELF